MHINGEVGVEGEEGVDIITPFLTPQHLATTPAQSYFSVLNSQESVDLYHDAYASLQHPLYSHHAKAERRRHASVGATRENGSAVEMSLVDSKKTNGVLPLLTVSGRARHASCNTSSPATHTNLRNSYSHPYHIGRLSLSTNSLKKKMDKDHHSRKMGSLQKIVGRGNWDPNYVPFVEVEVSESDPEARVPETSLTPGIRAPHLDKSSNSDTATWKRNYVQCVEADRLLGRIDEGDVPHLQQEIQLRPEHIESYKDTTVQMYTFGPVDHRQVGFQRVRQEFKLENIRLHHSVPHLFVSSQWQQLHRMSCLYLGYRIFWALYFSMWAIWAWVGSMGYDADISMKGYFMLYMTNWGIWLLAIDTTIQAINVFLHLKKISEDGDATYPSMTPLMKVSWILSNVTGALHIFITSAYWITVYPNRSDEELTEIGVNTHIIPGLYILLDAAVAATPRRLLHAYQPSMFIIIYTLFNLIYYLCGGQDYIGRVALYPTLDWTRPGSTIGIMSAVILGVMPFLHALLCALYAARVKVWQILKISRYIREEDETDQVEGGAEEQKV
ncbi:uncharacterized protein [Procambarus clarkii]|uniref:uncharacterized protein isoform X3 n=1 Tax=Procambarus clarkii TaxID=6728 RepID=UPI001E673D52|nr:uncharacterized protein LOC123768447 isoform X1 [Procambarus clarkii]